MRIEFLWFRCTLARECTSADVLLITVCRSVCSSLVACLNATFAVMWSLVFSHCVTLCCLASLFLLCQGKESPDSLVIDLFHSIGKGEC